MSGIAPKHREVWHKVCPVCGNTLIKDQHHTGHSWDCTNQSCKYRIDVPYFGYVSPEQSAAAVDNDRELE